MIKIGDIVFVQNKGVCELLNITKNAFVGADKTKVYYVLKPVGSQNNMMIYFPTDSNVHIRKLCSKSKAISIFENFKDLDDLKFSDAEEKHNLFNQVSQKGELEDRARLLKMLLVQKNKTARKQFGFQDQKLINLMLNCVVSEISYVLEKDSGEIKSQLFQSLGVAAE